MNRVSGIALAAAAAGLFTSVSAPLAFAADAVKPTMVHCMGINSCKGASQCKTASNACAGQNSCKGHGWLPAANAKECADKGGTVEK